MNPSPCALTVITPCSRPQNLVRIRSSLPASCQWLVVLDRPNLDDAPQELRGEPGIEFLNFTGRGVCGNMQRNVGLSRASGDYVYFLDDDTVIHPQLTSVLAEYREARKIIVVNQLNADGSLRLRAAPPVRVNAIDSGQVLVPIEYAQRHFWKPDTPRADGFYFVALYRTLRKEFVFVDTAAAFYNYLR